MYQILSLLDDPSHWRQTMMDQWLDCRNKYLHILLEMEGRPTAPICSICNNHAGIKCPDCFGDPLFCRKCCVAAHRHSPFHHPLEWTATHYTQVSLHSLGYVLFIGHNGAPCPQTVEVCPICACYIHMLICIQGIKAMEISSIYKRNLSSHIHTTSLYPIDEGVQSPEPGLQLPTPRDTPQPDDHSTVPNISDTLFDGPELLLESEDHTLNRTYTASSGNPMLTIIDQTGVFEVEMVFCACSSGDHQDEQLLQSGLFPATFKSIKTLFTFSVLVDFLRDNLECKTTAQQYYSKLQGMTSKMFPDQVPVCCITMLILLLAVNEYMQNLYKQLLRASRQWRD